MLSRIRALKARGEERRGEERRGEKRRGEKVLLLQSVVNMSLKVTQHRVPGTIRSGMITILINTL